MAYTINRRLAELIDSNGQLVSGKIANGYITTAHYNANSITDTKLHTSFSLPASALTARDTGDLSEGSNLYYTDARADARIAAADTGDLSEGSNLYYTDARVGTYISGNRSYGNITTTGYIAGPATFTIDPAAVGDNTGTVVIAGNLQVDGTTTTINSTTLEVDDLNITLAAGSANSGAANGAGLTVDCGSGTDATLIYNGTLDNWEFNKELRLTTGSFVSHVNGNRYIKYRSDYDSAAVADFELKSDNNSAAVARITSTGTADVLQVFDNTTQVVTIADGGNVGIGTVNPSQGKLHIRGSKYVVTNSGQARGGIHIQPDTSAAAGEYGGAISFSCSGSGSSAIAAVNDGGSDHDSNGLAFFTHPAGTGSADAQEKMRITEVGDVGIGTPSPAVKLDLRGDMRLDGSAGTDRSIYFRNQGTVGGQVKSDKNLSLWAGNGSGSATQYLTVKEGGNVGIKTDTPDYTLEVVGDSMIGDASAVTSPAFGAQQQIAKSFTYGADGPGRNGNLYLINTNTGGNAGFVTFGGYSNHTNNLYYQTGGIGGGTEAQDGGSWGGYLSLFTTSDGSKGQASGMYEHMRITGDGHIQIKQTGSAPTNGVMLPGHIEFNGQGWDSNSGSDDMNAKIEMAATYGKVGSGATSPELVFSLQGAGGLDSSSEAYVEAMRLVGAGTYNNNEPRVGIGTSVPNKRLDVYTAVNTGGIQITGGTGATNTSLHINNTGSGGVNWNITSTGGGHGYGEGQLHFGVAYAVPKMRITSSGNVGIGHATGSHTPQKVLEVECPSEDFVTLGARTLGTSGNWAGVHFGYKENTNTYRKSAIVFERTDLTENNAQGKVHIFNGPQSGSGNATLSDRALTIHEDGTVQLGRPRALSSETSYTLQPFQFDLDCHVNGADEAAEEKDAVFSKIWRKSAVLHPGQYSNGNYYVGVGVNSGDTVNYVVFKVNLDKATSLYASAYVANSADGASRANKVYYSLDDTNWTQLNSTNWTAGGNTSSGTIDLKTLAGFQGQVATGQGNFFTGTVFIKFAIEGTGSGHTNLIGWSSFLIRATAQHASLTGGGFGRSKNDLTLAGNSNTGHGYAPLLHSYGHQFTGQNGNAIASSNSGTQTFSSNGLGHLEESIFKPVTTASDGLNGIQVLKTGILHGTFIQDIITVGSTSYASCTVRRYNEAKTNSVPVCYTLRINTDGQWDMINGQFICDVVAGDFITFTYVATSIASMDNGSWSHYGLMLHPSAITSQGTAGTNLPWIHQ